MGEIGDAERKVAQGLLDSPKAFFDVLDPVAQPFHGRHGFFGRCFGSAQLRDLLGAFLEFAPELLDLCRQDSPLIAEFLNHIPWHILPTPSQRCADKVGIVAKKFRIVHESPFKKRLESSIGVGESQRIRLSTAMIYQAPGGI